MMKLTLRKQILWGSLATTMLALLAVFVLVDGALRSTILADQTERVEWGTRLASDLIDAEVEEGLNHMTGAAETPTLRAALETGDSATIRQNLDQLRESADVEWLAVAAPDGTLLATTLGTPTRIAAARDLVRQTREYDTGDLWRVDGEVVQVYATGIFVGTAHLGALVGGLPIGEASVARLRAATQQRIAVVTAGAVTAAEDLPSDQREELARAWSHGGGGEGVRRFSLAGAEFLGATLPLPDATGRPVGALVVFRSLDEAMRPARDLRLALLGIVVLAIVFASASSYLLARRVVRPVNRLLQETVRLGSGELETPIEGGRDDEIGRLAQGFERMRVSLRDAQQELLRAERLSAVGRAASAIVHDIRQPVMVIQGYVTMLKTDLEDRDQREEDLLLIESELARLNGMMTEILDYARGGEGMEVTEGAPRELLEEVVRPIRPLLEGKGIALEVEHGYTGRWSLDFRRTRRALENLVRNAASVVEPGGTVRVRSRETDAGLRLVVEDTGPGIPEAIRANLFEPFVTHGKAEGTGLGLAIVKAFTERQGGSVRFETSAQGTRFLLDFPARGAA